MSPRFLAALLMLACPAFAQAPKQVTVTIGVTTALLSAAGLFAGRRFGAVLGKRLDAAGGLVLIGLGTKILVDR